MRKMKTFTITKEQKERLFGTEEHKIVETAVTIPKKEWDKLQEKIKLLEAVVSRHRCDVKKTGGLCNECHSFDNLVVE
jgi:DNA gyrase/topoisomerase IV subunit A